jgi:hypothetical protein
MNLQMDATGGAGIDENGVRRIAAVDNARRSPAGPRLGSLTVVVDAAGAIIPRADRQPLRRSANGGNR